MKTSLYKRYTVILGVLAVLIVMPCYGQMNIEYQGGYIFNGEGFTKQTLYVRAGSFTFTRPATIDSVIHVDGTYMIPPFADAHTHNLDRNWQVPGLSDRYLDEGVFYIQNLTSRSDAAAQLKTYFSSSETVDVMYSMAGLTSTLGHPFMAYEPFAMNIPFNEWDQRKDEILASRTEENNSYIFIDTPQDVDSKLDLFYSLEPDIAKVFLINTRDYEKNIKNTEAQDTGLSAEVASVVIKQLKERGLVVYAHIEDTFDFELSIENNVDVIAHMPGYNWDGTDETRQANYSSDELLDQAVQQGVAIIPTITQALFRFAEGDSVKKADFTADFLSRFKDAGGEVLIGADFFNQTLNIELNNFYDIGVYSNLEILNIASVITPRYLYPNRKIGKIEEGYEASLLVLSGNPIEQRITDLDILHILKGGLVIK